MDKDKKHSLPGALLDEETSLKIRQALQTVDVSSLAHISEVRSWNLILVFISCCLHCLATFILLPLSSPSHSNLHTPFPPPYPSPPSPSLPSLHLHPPLHLPPSLRY